MELTLTSEIAVEEVQQVGSDETLARAAWVVGKKATHTPQGKPINEQAVEGVLKTMMQKRHGTPFEHGFLTILVHAPIKVWREWHRHRIAWSYNEESGRYKQLEAVFYVPPRERPMIRPEGFKSMNPKFDTVMDDAEYERIVERKRRGYEAAYANYEECLADGEDRGLARDVLGVGIYSSCWCSANPRSIMAFLELRTHEPQAKRPSHPLYEIQVAARKLEAIFARYWPVTHRLWCEHGRMAP